MLRALRKLVGLSRTPSRRQPAGSFRPRLESLEDRRVLSATVVTPLNLGPWATQASGGSTVSFVQGPATPPLGTGSAKLTVDPSGATAAQLRNTAYAGTELADLTELKYSTYVEFNQSGQTPYLILNVDLDGNLATTTDRTLLFFEPEYQHGYTNAVPDQGDNVLGEWQEWDALAGGWWSTTGVAGAGPGANVKPLSIIIAAFPDAVVFNPISAGSPVGGVRIVAGFGGPGDWGGFVGYVDAFEIGVSGTTDAYDFELYSSPTSKDQVKDGGWRDFNPDRPEGPFKNQGDAVSYIASQGRAKGNPGTPAQDHGNNGVGNGSDDGQPPGEPPLNDGPGTQPGSPARKGPK